MNEKKRNDLKLLGVILAANMEAVVVMLISHFGGKWLSEQYPNDIDWSRWAYLVGIVAIFLFWMRLFRYLIQQNDDSKNNK